MTNNERKDLRNLGSQNGLRDSTSDSRSQIGGGNKVTHVDNNRTIVNGSTYYGFSAAKNAMKKS